MGIYTSLRFKGIVKKEFRDKFEDIALNGNWANSEDEILREFGEDDPRAEFIPCGVPIYIPMEWTTSDGFARVYDKNTGLWIFQCSVKNQLGTIETFFDIVPLFMEKVECAEIYEEGSNFSSMYGLVDDKIILLKPIHNFYLTV